MHIDHLSPSVVGENPVSTQPSINYKAPAAELIGHVFPGLVVRLGARGVAFMADANWRLEYLGIEAFDWLVSPLQIVEIERSVLRRCAQNGREITAFRLMLAGIRFIAVTNPA